MLTSISSTAVLQSRLLQHPSLFSVTAAGVALIWLGSERLRRAGLEALFGCSPVVHAAPHRLCGRCPHQIRGCLQSERHAVGARGFPANLVIFLPFLLLRYLFRVQMRKASMPVPPCLPIWKQNRWTLRKKSVNDRCTTSAFTCSSSTVTGKCPPVLK